MYRCCDCHRKLTCSTRACPSCGCTWLETAPTEEPLERAPTFAGRPLVTLPRVLALLLGAALLGKALDYPRATSRSSACKSNLKNIATALEMWSVDYGQYPDSLSRLTPNYLKVIPVCPNADSDTYSGAYRRCTLPQAYTVCCGGLNHQNEPNYPQYTSAVGLIEWP